MLNKIALLIIGLAVFIFIYYSEYNTKKITFQNNTYYVHNGYKNKCDAAGVLNEINKRMEFLLTHMKQKFSTNLSLVSAGGENFNMHDRTVQFETNYNPHAIYEISPKNPMGNTSFTEGKGTRIVMCLRDKETGKIHDINTLMFVALHEISHVMNDGWGHEEHFWHLFHIVLEEAVAIKIYEPVNYEANPQKYCGITITNNPLF